MVLGQPQGEQGAARDTPIQADRIIHVTGKSNGDDGPNISPFCENSVYTTKYTAASFLPLFLLHQFSRAPNLFFLAISVLQQVPGVSPTSRMSTIMPLLFILTASAVKEILEDRKRKRADEKANSSRTEVCGGGEDEKSSFLPATWAQVVVGDVVRVRRDESFPADLIFLDSSESSGVCFVETANIDGETNLKVKESAMANWEAGRRRMTVVVEAPCEQIYSFTGRLMIDEEAKSLTVSNLLLRGSTLRNTDWIIGVAVYTGPETRIMKNGAAHTPIKQPRLDREVNRHMTVMLGVLLFMVVGSFAWWTGHVFLAGGRRMPHLRWIVWPEFTAKALLFRFFTYIVLYHSIIPISLLVTMEICRFHLARLVSSDLSFFSSDDDADDEDGDGEMVGVKVANSNIVDDLGQVSYVLSDKTGTLTMNKMELLKVATVQGQVHTPATIRGDLLEAMAVCHTVMIDSKDTDDDGDNCYRASSPDELAIVKGCAQAGCRFSARSPTTLTLHTAGTPQVYRLLHLVEYSSERKRMSIVVQRECEEDRVMVVSKGADDVILQRLSPGQNTVDLTEAVIGFAASGLRTLVYAWKEMGVAEWSAWRRTFLDDPTARRGDDASDQLESGLTLLGATAVEDKLAPRVPETLALFREAGIKVWILTGDRIETALNVAVACGFYGEETGPELLILSQPSQLDVLARGVTAKRKRKFVLAVEGRTLDQIIEVPALTDKFMDLAIACSSLICSRTTPLQKRRLTQLLHLHTQAIILAVGDGANDVGMIQAAAVGVGIGGKEGMQAARSADIAISKFSHLSRLLLVHGAWSYSRLSKTIIYCSYKNLLLVTSQFWFALWCAASGQTVYESWMLTLSSPVFTSWVPIVIGVTDQYLTAPLLLAHPALYKTGQRNAALSAPKFWKAALNSALQSLALFLIHAAVLGGDPIMADGSNGGIWIFSSTYYASALLTILYKAAIISNSLNVFTWLILGFGIVAWYAYLLAADYGARQLGITSASLYGLAPKLLSYGPFWLLILIAPILVLLRDFAWKYVKRLYLPREYHIVQELEMLARTSRADMAKSVESMVSLQSTSSLARHIEEQPRLDGFAFSQAPGQAALLRRVSTDS